VRSLSTEEQETLRNARTLKLVERFRDRQRLTRFQLDEIREIIGDDLFSKAIAELGDQPITADDARTSDQYLHGLAHYAEIYRRSARQLKRWVKAGRYAKPPEFPPLDSPEKMLAWWNRMLTAGQLKQKPPAVLEQFAIDAVKDKTSAAGLGSITVSKLTVEEGAELKQARQFLAATATQLSDAYEKGDDASIGRVQNRWKQALDAVRLASEHDRRSAIASGDLLSKHEIVSELSILIETVRNMQRTMSRRIRSRLGILPPEIDAKLDGAIEAERSREEAVLRRSKIFRDIGEVILELDQAAGIAA
jgi:hypothetical protein